MEQTNTILKIVLPVFLALFFGYFSKQKKIITSEGVNGLKGFIVNFVLPVALFRAVGSIHYSTDMAVSVLVIFIACATALCIGFMILKAFPKLPRMLPFLVTCTEAGMLGFALYTQLFGLEKLPFVAQAALGCDLFVFTIYSAILRSKEGNGGVKVVVNEMFKSPIFISILLGVIFGSTGLYPAMMSVGFSDVLNGVFDLFISPLSFTMLFVVGYSIDVSLDNIKMALCTSGVRIVVMGSLCALVVFILNKLIVLDAYLMWAIILLFSLPGPYILPVLAKDKKDQSFASTALSLHMLISIGIFCIITMLAT